MEKYKNFLETKYEKESNINSVYYILYKAGLHDKIEWLKEMLPEDYLDHTKICAYLIENNYVELAKQIYLDKIICEPNECEHIWSLCASKGLVELIQWLIPKHRFNSKFCSI